MAWDDISDLWWLQPGKGDTADILLRGAATASAIGQRRDYQQGMLEQRHDMLELNRMRVESAMQVQRSKEKSETMQAAGISRLNAHLADVAARGAWDDPAAEAEYWRIWSEFPQAGAHDMALKMHENTFLRARDYKTKETAATTKAALDQERLEIARTRAVAATETAEAAMLRAQSYAAESEPTVIEKEGHKFLKFRGTLREMRDVEELVVDGHKFIVSPQGGVTRVDLGGDKVPEANKLRYNNEVKALHLDYTLNKLKDEKGNKISPEEFKKRLDAVAEKYLGEGAAATTAPLAAPLASTPAAPRPVRAGLSNSVPALAEPPPGLINTNKPMEFDFDPATGQLKPR